LNAGKEIEAMKRLTLHRIERFIASLHRFIASSLLLPSFAHNNNTGSCTWHPPANPRQPNCQQAEKSCSPA
jgi:hypothetical protein